MILSLRVKNIAIIEEEEIEFSKGLNIMSGETGAGKSIILGALALAMGEKAFKGIIRDESKEAVAEAVFEVNAAQQKRLLDMEIDCPDGQLILQRKITSQRTVSKINGENMPASKLAQAGEIMVDIYGQHEQQTLLSRKNHIKLLDEYAGSSLSNITDEIALSYKKYNNLMEEYESSIIDEQERAREEDMLTHEINRIEAANLVIGEDEELKKEYKKLIKREKIVVATSKGLDIIESTVADNLSEAIRSLKDIQQEDEEIENIVSALLDADSIISDSVTSLKTYASDLEYGEDRLNVVSSRIDELDALKRMFSRNGSIEEVVKALEKKQERLSKLKDYEAYQKGLKQELESCKESLLALCKKASDIRDDTAKKLSKLISEALWDLNFEGANVDIRVESLEEPTSKGMDSVCIYISTNMGEKMLPLNDIASGGELSRIMLAIKTIFAASGDVDTLIFDEIDAGVSGRAAARVAARLTSLSGTSQVICITHLPQIAAKADYHLLIEKTSSNEGSISSIRPLFGEERVRELARMLAGDDINEAAIANAKALMS